MDATSTALSRRARAAAQARDWNTVRTCATGLLQRNPAEPEGHFLAGLAARGDGRLPEAAEAFARALAFDAARYDAAIELAAIRQSLGRNAEAVQLLKSFEGRLGNSPMYLDLAGSVYSRLGLHEPAGPLFEQANRLQPGVASLQANLAACLVYLGRIDDAAAIYRELLERFPHHQRHHYQLANLKRATDDGHVEQMKTVLLETGLPPERNVFLYYAIGKELEDLERWDEAFHYYRLAGDAVSAFARYDVRVDLDLIDGIIRCCSGGWLADSPGRAPAAPAATPVFIVGLPRTGTTLAERILSSHSRVESAGETFYMQGAVQRHSSAAGGGAMTAAAITAAAQRPIGFIGQSYLEDVAYRLSGKSLFIDKFPENFLYLGFIAKAFPHARIVHLTRHPLDTCLALYKQSFFRYAYSLEDLGRYYAGHERLRRHWLEILGDRLVELRYEELVADQEGQTRRLLDAVGLEFEPACLEFERNPTAAATASAAQVRERIHGRSVGRWKRFAGHLGPLREVLAAEGVVVDES